MNLQFLPDRRVRPYTKLLFAICFVALLHPSALTAEIYTIRTITQEGNPVPGVMLGQTQTDLNGQISLESKLLGTQSSLLEPSHSSNELEFEPKKLILNELNCPFRVCTITVSNKLKWDSKIHPVYHSLLLEIERYSKLKELMLPAPKNEPVESTATLHQAEAPSPSCDWDPHFDPDSQVLSSVNALGANIKNGVQHNLISGNGRYTVFQAFEHYTPDDTDDHYDTHVLDRDTGKLTRITLPTLVNGNATQSWINPIAISAEGTYVLGVGLMEIDAASKQRRHQLFRINQFSGEVRLVSKSAIGQPGKESTRSQADMSADGRFITYVSKASNLTTSTDATITQKIFLYDAIRDDVIQITPSIPVSAGQKLWFSSPHISDNGEHIAFTVKSISKNSTGRKIASVWSHDRVTGSTELISKALDGTLGNGASECMGLSADGTQVLFRSRASNLYPDDTNKSEDLFVFNRTTNLLERINVRNDRREPHGLFGFSISGADMSADGKFIVFDSRMDDLTDNHENTSQSDVYLFDRTKGQLRLLSQSLSNPSQVPGMSLAPHISANGKHLTFATTTPLGANDDDSAFDIYNMSNPFVTACGSPLPVS